ncbi:hypothetical protein [Anaeromicropila populeti]|uniref:Uncharacterized protein n=1 Tax=Anaeromicropila populeti TaxID=37658 RepID=A0A1I6JLZ9_9FIRM|nr:hypothetical protein [Anaeromicropila populeti]SFR79995.1 hypothetical protein SAMN05661086_01746 [Anaeromicropila populeti]
MAMRQDYCLNFCEMIQNLYEKYVNFDDAIEHCLKEEGEENCQRIYFGSSFCGQHFLHITNKIVSSLAEACMRKGIKLTLVIPTFSERNLDRGKDKIKEFAAFCENCLDEMTVNDFGMLDFVSKNYQVNLNLGRLFMKDYRDPRYEQYFHQILAPKIFTGYLLNLLEQYPITGMEFDPTHEGIDFSAKPEKIQIGIHLPYCYMTVGHICEFASIPVELEKKFRPNIQCQNECMKNLIRYHFDDEYKWMRLGKTIYFWNKSCKIVGTDQIRVIYFPYKWEVAQ